MYFKRLCQEHDFCLGMGDYRHIRRWFGSQSVDQILQGLADCCGNRWANTRSCGCTFNVAELAKRGVIVHSSFGEDQLAQLIEIFKKEW